VLIAQLRTAVVLNKHEAKYILLIVPHSAVLFTTLIENLRLCFSSEAGIVLNLFLDFEQK